MIPRSACVCALALMFVAPAVADTINTPSCRQELAAIWSNLQEMLGRLKSTARSGQDERCETYRHHATVVERAREVFARCKTGRDRAGDVAHMDGALEDVNSVIDRECNGGLGTVRPHVLAPLLNDGEMSTR